MFEGRKTNHLRLIAFPILVKKMLKIDKKRHCMRKIFFFCTRQTSAFILFEAGVPTSLVVVVLLRNIGIFGDPPQKGLHNPLFGWGVRKACKPL